VCECQPRVVALLAACRVRLYNALPPATPYKDRFLATHEANVISVSHAGESAAMWDVTGDTPVPGTLSRPPIGRCHSIIAAGLVVAWSMLTRRCARPLCSGDVVLSGSSDGTACLWSLKTGARLHILEGHGQGVDSTCYDPRIRRVGVYHRCLSLVYRACPLRDALYLVRCIGQQLSLSPLMRCRLPLSAGLYGRQGR
jgi:hypothetical protein